MKAVICPVCKGNGVLLEGQMVCNGCSGKGWVEVHEELTPSLPIYTWTTTDIWYYPITVTPTF